jgi:hypothetical protein
MGARLCVLAFAMIVSISELRADPFMPLIPSVADYPTVPSLFVHENVGQPKGEAASSARFPLSRVAPSLDRQDVRGGPRPQAAREPCRRCSRN